MLPSCNLQFLKQISDLVYYWLVSIKKWPAINSLILRVTSNKFLLTISPLCQRNNHQLKKLLTVKQILPVSTSGNVKRTVWRIYILMLGCTRKGQLNLQYYWEWFQGTLKEAVPMSASLRVLHRSLSPFLREFLFQHQPWDDAIGMVLEPMIKRKTFTTSVLICWEKR